MPIRFYNMLMCMGIDAESFEYIKQEVEQQIAEKDKEIAELKSRLAYEVNANNFELNHLVKG